MESITISIARLKRTCETLSSEFSFVVVFVGSVIVRGLNNKKKRILVKKFLFCIYRELAVDLDLRRGGTDGRLGSSSSSSVIKLKVGGGDCVVVVG
jgi:hypothetical protein